MGSKSGRKRRQREQGSSASRPQQPKPEADGGSGLRSRAARTEAVSRRPRSEEGTPPSVPHAKTEPIPPAPVMGPAASTPRPGLSGVGSTDRPPVWKPPAGPVPGWLAERRSGEAPAPSMGLALYESDGSEPLGRMEARLNGLTDWLVSWLDWYDHHGPATAQTGADFEAQRRRRHRVLVGLMFVSFLPWFVFFVAGSRWGWLAF